MSAKPPVDFSPDLVAEVCGLISVGNSLRKIERMEGMPTKAAIMKWLLEGEAYKANGEPEHPKAVFVDQYARAREVQADTLAEEILEIADDSTFDTALDENGKVIVNMEHIQRDRLRVDSRKWLAGKLRPKKYGDKVQVGGDPENPVKHEHNLGQLTIEELRSLARLGAND